MEPMTPQERRILLKLAEPMGYEAAKKEIAFCRRLQTRGLAEDLGGQVFTVTKAGAQELQALKKVALPSDEGGEACLGVFADAKTEDRASEALPTVPLSKSAAVGAGQKNAANRKRVLVTTDEKRVNDEAIAGLRADPDVYQRSGKLVRVSPRSGFRVTADDTPDTPEIEEVPTATLREKLAQHCFFLTAGEDGAKPCHPPEWCVRAVYARGYWEEFRMLKSVVEFPVLRRDGSVLQTPGYDAQTCLEYRPNCTFPQIPDDPTEEEIQRAKDLFAYAVADFPFAKPMHFSSWLAGALTPFARYCFRGPSPLFLMDANVRGIGKTTLADIVHIMLTGDIAPRSSQLFDDAEESKRITSIARAGVPMLLIDNCSKPIGNGVLDGMLTSTSWRERLMSTNEVPTYPLLFTTWATANNAQIRSGADTARRTCWTRLESRLANPEDRTDLKERDLYGWVREHRGELVVAALTLLRSYFLHHTAPIELPPWGSYEGWSSVIRACLVWHGYEDPHRAQQEFSRTLDPTAAGLEMLIDGWRELCQANKLPAITVGEALELLHEDLEYKARTPGYRLRYQALVTALAEMAPTHGRALPDVKTVGMLLRTYKGRVANGWRIDQLGKTKTGQQWVAVQVDAHKEAAGASEYAN
jgi:hypothetical protein